MSSTRDGQPRILVMDANESNADLLSDFLAEEGYEPVAVTDIESADEATEDASQFAFATIDIDRFDNPVWSYCEELHEAGVPFIVLGGVQNPTLRRESREHGADAFVDKPVPKREFLNLIESAVNSSP